jgi:putative YhdH/YhfP family quinone oxidoreductase
MTDHAFRALRVTEIAPKTFARTVEERRISDLPPGELLVRVRWSSLNFKDALSATGRPGVTRKYPHTPGIDAAGEVVSCGGGPFRPGDAVIVTGFDLGMDTPGGYGQYIRVPSSWAVPLPGGLTPRTAMVLGTAGLTAAISVSKVAGAGIAPGDGEVLVTGATGGVGCLAVAILAKIGYRVTASTGKAEEEGFLKRLGASSVVDREAVTAGAERPLMKERWGAVVDTVGGATLAAALKGTRHGGAVTACGLVAGADLSVSVFPFILRGVSLLGVDSVNCPLPERTALWRKLASEWHPAPEALAELSHQRTLSTLEEPIHAILEGKLVGRTVVDLE